jgi:hypothetical protein
MAGQIGRIDTARHIREFPVPDRDARAHAITADPQAAVGSPSGPPIASATSPRRGTSSTSHCPRAANRTGSPTDPTTRFGSPSNAEASRESRPTNRSAQGSADGTASAAGRRRKLCHSTCARHSASAGLSRCPRPVGRPVMLRPDVPLDQEAIVLGVEDRRLVVLAREALHGLQRFPQREHHELGVRAHVAPEHPDAEVAESRGVARDAGVPHVSGIGVTVVVTDGSSPDSGDHPAPLSLRRSSRTAPRHVVSAARPCRNRRRGRSSLRSYASAPSRCGASVRGRRGWRRTRALAAPDRFDVSCKASGHLGVGTGIHACVAHMQAEQRRPRAWRSCPSAPAAPNRRLRRPARWRRAPPGRHRATRAGRRASAGHSR